MTKGSAASRSRMIGIPLLIVAAAAFRLINMVWYHDQISTMAMLRSLIYIGIFSAWGVAIYRRIIQNEVRNLVIAIAVLIVFWIGIRTYKYQFVREPNAARYIWYLYYLPMLMIPTLIFLTAYSLRQPEGYRLPSWQYLIYAVTGALILLVLTNDLHQCVFYSYEGDIVHLENHYGYRPGYFLCLAWAVIMMAAAFGIAFLKCRKRRGRHAMMAPLLPGAAMLHYSITYGLGLPVMRLLFYDLPVCMSLMMVTFLELSIWSGLIPSNVGYEELFSVGMKGMQIVDRQGQVCFQSSNSRDVSEEQIRGTILNGSSQIDEGMMLESNRIRGGYVLWQNDVAELLDSVRRLEENREVLTESLSLQQETYRVRREAEELREKSRLYDQLQETTKTQMIRVDSLLNQLFSSDDREERRRIFRKLVILLAFVKRRGNLCLIGERDQRIACTELALCFEESAANLELSGIACAVEFTEIGDLFYTDAARIYDFFEAVVETAGESLEAVLTRLSETTEGYLFQISAESTADLKALAATADVFTSEEGIWTFRMTCGKWKEVGNDGLLSS